jgi:cell wall-associated NlpC family hydrolase
MLRITNAKFFRSILTLIGVVLLCVSQPGFTETTQQKTTTHHATTHKNKTTKKNHTHKKTKKHSKQKHHTVSHKPKHHAQLRPGAPNSQLTEQSEAETTTSDKPINHDLATVNLGSMSQPNSSLSMLFSVKQNIVSFIKNTVNNLHYSSYKLGGSRFDTQRGVYVLDCSNFVDRVLEKVYPNAYTSLVNSTGADNPASTHYFTFFRDLSDDSDDHWNKIDEVEKLQAGDVLVFRYKNSRGHETGGHVMVVMDKPTRVSDVYFIRIADSAPSRHSEDTRQQNESGIGIGTLLLKANPKTGEPSAFAWGVNSDWNRRVKIAMARPIEIDTSLS